MLEGPGTVKPTIRSRNSDASQSANAVNNVAPNDFNVRTYDETEVVTVGKTREPFVDRPDSRTACLLAYTCNKSSCYSQGSEHRPLLFTRPSGEFIIGEHGRVMRPKWTDIKESINLVWGPPLCPVCGKNDRVKPYVLPEIRQRQNELKRELVASRAALRKARKAKRDLPDDIRPPVEIFAEINALPQLYLKRELPEG